MIKIIIAYLLLPVILNAQCPNGQSKVNINITTDQGGSEVYWQLVPSGNNCGTGVIFAGGNNSLGCSSGGTMTFPSGGYGYNITVSEGPWCLTTGGTYDILYVDDMGDGGAEFDVYIDSFPVFTSLTGLGKTPYSTLEFKVSPALAYDFTCNEIDILPYNGIGNIDVIVNFFNRSTDTIHNFDFNYRIDNNPIVSQSIFSQSILPFTSLSYTHSVQWSAQNNGAYKLKAWASNLDGNLDMNLNNDTLSKVIYIGPSVPNIIDTYLGLIPQKTIIANAADGIIVPRDLDFHPVLTNNELWVVLKSTEAAGGKTAKISNAGEVNQTVLIQQDWNAWHFMSLPTGIAFSDNGNFATSPGVLDANHTVGMSPYTGPTLWSSDSLIYVQPSSGNGSHLDMLHESPYSMGIAFEKENKFWVNDGFHSTVVSYDFQEDHGPGGSNHSDGIIKQYSGMGLVEDPAKHIPSHLVFDKNTGWLYIADTGNGRIVRLNTATGSKIGNLSPNEPVMEYGKYVGYTSSVYVNSGLVKPSGIDLIGNRMIVSDHSNGDIIIYDISGNFGLELGRIQTGTAGIMGLKIGPDGKIWYVNATTNQVVRIDPINVTSVLELTKKEISVYPNPSNGVFTIVNTNSEKIEYIKVFSIDGKEISSEITELNSLQSGIKINCKPGMYFLETKVGESITRLKVIVD